jgi:hypothetical protein
MSDFDMDPPIGRIVNPIGRIEISHDKRIRFIFIGYGTGVSVTCQDNKTAIVIGSCFTQINMGGLRF